MNAAPPARLRVLVADDHRDTVLTLTTLLRDEGFEVHGAYTGADVLKLSRLLAFDAVVCDLVMPDLSGFAIARELRILHYGARGPALVAISGCWNRPSERMLSELVGFDHHLTKPCDPVALIRLLAALPACARDSAAR